MTDNVFSARPRNRQNKKLGLLDERIVHAEGVVQADPNKMELLLASGEIARLSPLPDCHSILSGHPAVRYQTDDLDLALTTRELSRLLAREMRPHEFFALRSCYGDAFAWHDDFYDTATGVAVQPKMRFNWERPEGQLEKEPPVACWPREPHPMRTALTQCASFLVRHPMVAAGYFDLRKAEGADLPIGRANELTREDVVANLALIQHERLYRMAIAGQKSTDPTERALYTLAVDLNGLLLGFQNAMANMATVVAATPDFPGVHRISPKAMVVQASTLAARGKGSWDMQRIDAPRQAEQLLSLVKSVLTTPAAAQEQLRDLLEKNHFDRSGESNAPRRVFIDPTLVEQFRPFLDGAVALAAMAASMRLKNESSTAEPAASQLARKTRPGIV